MCTLYTDFDAWLNLNKTLYTYSLKPREEHRGGEEPSNLKVGGGLVKKIYKILLKSSVRSGL